MDDTGEQDGSSDPLTIGIPKEIDPGESRIAVDPDTAEKLADLGYSVVVESSAGKEANFPDEQYADAGADIEEERGEVWKRADIVLKIHPPREIPDGDEHELDLLDEGDVLVSLFSPDQNEDLIDRAAERGATVFALDAVPRTTRAQAVDVLSSMAVLAGYRSVVDAAANLGRSFGAQVTAAGSTPPAEVLVIGAGVAGLSAIATAGDMGAQVRAFDVRPAVEKEVESVGGQFLKLDFETVGAEGEGGYAKEMDEEFIEAELDLFRREIPDCDVVITTAAIPGKEAPKLVLEDMVESMEPGSVIVDLAAATGGNCELTLPGKSVEHDGVRILGPTNLPAEIPGQASTYFGRNLANFIEILGDADSFEIDEDDQLVRSMLVVRDGENKWPPPPIEDSKPESSPQPDSEKAPETGGTLQKHREQTEKRRKSAKIAGITAAAAVMLLVGLFAPDSFVEEFSLFVLACVIGWQVVWNVTPSLHTPLISVTNAISGIIIVGGIVVATSGSGGVALGVGAAAAGIAAVNVFGGFLVTHRMLGMFRSEQELDEEPSTEA